MESLTDSPSLDAALTLVGLGLVCLALIGSSVLIGIGAAMGWKVGDRAGFRRGRDWGLSEAREMLAREVLICADRPGAGASGRCHVTDSVMNGKNGPRVAPEAPVNAWGGGSGSADEGTRRGPNSVAAENAGKETASR